MACPRIHDYCTHLNYLVHTNPRTKRAYPTLQPRKKQLNPHIPDIPGTNKAGGPAGPRMNFTNARFRMR